MRLSALENLLGFGFGFCEPSILTGFNAWRHWIIQKLAEFVFAFATTNIRLKLVLVVLNIPLYFLLGRLLFGSRDRFLGVLRKGIVIHLLGPFVFLFYRSLERVRSVIASRSELRLANLVDLLWVSFYVLEYILIKSLFLS